ncbi:hypothetical protein MMC28_008730 [Mycoblastus sanguinarius]|nr:hypothetical protein [Mycoblastus sanguinarius]
MNHRPCSQYDDQRHGLESDKEEIMKAKETLEGVKHEDRKALNSIHKAQDSRRTSSPLSDQEISLKLLTSIGSQLQTISSRFTLPSKRSVDLQSTLVIRRTDTMLKIASNLTPDLQRSCATNVRSMAKICENERKPREDSFITPPELQLFWSLDVNHGGEPLRAPVPHHFGLGVHYDGKLVRWENRILGGQDGYDQVLPVDIDRLSARGKKGVGLASGVIQSFDPAVITPAKKISRPNSNNPSNANINLSTSIVSGTTVCTHTPPLAPPSTSPITPPDLSMAKLTSDQPAQSASDQITQASQLLHY